jgi:hypothetical protein
MRFSPLAAAQSLTILLWPEALNASRSKRACRMAIRRNACSLLALPDFPELSKQLAMVSPELLTTENLRPCIPSTAYDYGLLCSVASCQSKGERQKDDQDRA